VKSSKHQFQPSAGGYGLHLGSGRNAFDSACQSEVYVYNNILRETRYYLTWR
jgi:hypothetical protein